MRVERRRPFTSPRPGRLRYCNAPQGDGTRRAHRSFFLQPALQTCNSPQLVRRGATPVQEPSYVPGRLFLFWLHELWFSRRVAMRSCDPPRGLGGR